MFMLERRGCRFRHFYSFEGTGLSLGPVLAKVMSCNNNKMIVERGGLMVDSAPFVRMVVGSNSTLAAV